MLPGADKAVADDASVILAGRFGTKPRAGEAIKLAEEAQDAVRIKLSAAQLHDYNRDVVVLAQEVGSPCYFGELMALRERFALDQEVASATTILGESAKQLERVKLIGAKQELLNWNWDRSRIQVCTDLANKHMASKSRRSQKRKTS
jgi:hypothetical protein